MTERISIFNYEAFYLDYIEGNLDEKDTALLMEFLKKNPDLIEDDLGLPFLDDSEITFNQSLKSELKQFDEVDEIDKSNVEFFMISNAEGLNSPKKQQELESFIELNPTYQKDFEIYQKTTLSPESELTYQHKENLKEKNRVLWPAVITISAAASLIFFFMNFGATVDSNQGYSYARVGRSIGVGSKNITPVAVANLGPKVASNQIVYSSKSEGQVKQEPLKMQTRTANTMLTSIGKVQREPISKSLIQEPKKQVSTNNMAYASAQEMENPIAPLTRFVSEKTNTDIDFQRSKERVNNKRNFSIKVGKFSFSRKRN